jgi:hypothetical protein
VSGTPRLRDSRPFAADSPVARFQDHENPYFLLRGITGLPVTSGTALDHESDVGGSLSHNRSDMTDP